MSNDMNQHRINRILVAVDASPNSLAALRAAVDLAQRLQAEVHGLFIKDINLQRLGMLPSIQEIGLFTGHTRPISDQQIRRQLRVLSNRARLILETLAEQAHVRWRYRVLQGTTTTDLREAAADADLIVLGRSGWSGRRKIGSTVQFMLSQYPTRTLIVGETPSPQAPVLVLYDGSDSSKRALDSAGGLVRGSSGFLIVAILADSPKRAKRLQREAYRSLNEEGIEPRFRWLLNWSAEKLNRLVGSENCVLVLPSTIKPNQDISLAELINELDCPVLLIQ